LRNYITLNAVIAVSGGQSAMRRMIKKIGFAHGAEKSKK